MPDSDCIFLATHRYNCLGFRCLPELAQCLAQLLLIDGGELIGNGCWAAAERALQSHDAGSEQRQQLIPIAGHQSSPETNINVDLAACRCHLSLQRLHCCCCGRGISARA